MSNPTRDEPQPQRELSSHPDVWRKLVATILHKLKLPCIEITAEDQKALMEAYRGQPPVLWTEELPNGGVELSIMSRAEAIRITALRESVPAHSRTKQ